MNKKVLLVGGVILVALCVAAIGYSMATRPGSPGNKLRVVAGLQVWGNIASQIGGDTVQVTSLVSDPNADPHLYESNAEDSLAVAKADIVIVNGLGYDAFLTKLIDASKGENRDVIEAAAGVQATQNTNPHIWYDFVVVEQVAKSIASSLKVKDPGHASQYDQNLSAFLASLAPLHKTIADIRAAHAGVAIAYTEPVSAYVIQAAGLTDKTPPGFAQAIENGSEPSAADQLQMSKLLASHQVAVLIYNTQAESPVTQHMRELAIQNDTPVVSFTETMPSNSSFQDWQTYQLFWLQGALSERQ